MGGSDQGERRIDGLRPKETPPAEVLMRRGFRPHCHGKEIWGRFGNASRNPVFRIETVSLSAVLA
jgi:hypothetical protein